MYWVRAAGTRRQSHDCGGFGTFSRTRFAASVRYLRGTGSPRRFATILDAVVAAHNGVFFGKGRSNLCSTESSSRFSPNASAVLETVKNTVDCSTRLDAGDDPERRKPLRVLSIILINTLIIFILFRQFKKIVICCISVDK